MRIYLDSNVFRDLKREENKDLYDLIFEDKDRNYYYFSEAHIQDLIQDHTDMKLNDMGFMDAIVGNNCWHYDKKMEVQCYTPLEYYHAYTWNTGVDSMSDDVFYTLIKESFRAIPLSWEQFIDIENLPQDFPEDFRPMLLESVTMLDFMDAMLDLTDNLTTQQPRFKLLLQYLHRSMDGNTLYEKLGITGFDGKDFTDWNAFTKSFTDLIYQRTQQKDLYSQFTEMQTALDIYGIVKGKPKKQKFMSLINDGKHTYFAGHAHILVTSDVDMIAKAKLVYKIWKIDTVVLTPEEFKKYLIETSMKDNSVAALFAQFNNIAELPVMYEQYTLDQIYVQKELPNWYLGEFNTVSCATAGGNTYYYFKQYFLNIPLNTLTAELERVVNYLFHYFGTDELGQGKFNRTEIEKTEWKGREWRSGEMGVILHLNQGMMLSFFKAAPASQ